MVTAAENFDTAVKSGATPYWLSFCGTSGAGKTYLADCIFDHVRDLKRIRFHPRLIHGAMRIHWPSLITKLYDRETWWIEDMADAHLLMLDEIASPSGGSAFEKECLCRTLLQRVDKWTLITSNHLLEQVRKQIDTRIASRMVRDGSVTIEVQTKDFALR